MMKHTILTFLLLALMPTVLHAQPIADEEMLDSSYRTLTDLITPLIRRNGEEKRSIWKHSDKVSLPNFGGYVIGSYKASGQEGDHGGEGFNLRLVRVYVDGTVMKDFKYRLQVELNGTPHIKDAFIAWSHWKALEVKMGEFKRCFTFENPYNPWDVGVGDYSQLTKKFAGFGDRCGESSTGGRDLGIQVQGDAFKSKHDGHLQFHYTVGIFNGNGINRRDNNHLKDLIANLQWNPIRDLRIGVFGWKGSWKSETGVNIDRKRISFGAQYESKKNHWSARAEYARSTGHKASDYVAATETERAYWKGGNKADAWYLTVGVPVWKWIKCYAKYDVYRDYASKSSMHTIYSLSANLQPHKNIMLQLQTNIHKDNSASDSRYGQFWAQAYVRF